MKASENLSVNQRARERVATELRRRGMFDVAEARDLNRTVLAGRTPTGRSLTVVVKSKTSGSWQTTIAEGDPNRVRRDVMWVFVDLGAGGNPSYFVAPDRWVREDIRQNHSEYLKRHGGRRPQTVDSQHHSIQPERVALWRDRWDLITG